MSEKTILAISLWEPWASALAGGFKLIETRHWPFPYSLPRPLAIHAAKHRAPKRDAWFEEEVAEKIGLDYWTMPRGAIVAVATLVDCAKVMPNGTLKTARGRVIELSDREEYFGNYEPGRFGWVFENVRKLEAPVPFKGRQGLFPVPVSVLNTEIPGSGSRTEDLFTEVTNHDAL
jgi:hypothetical protein